MTFDTVFDPISEDAPCGADLDATMDPAYEEYYFGALGRLPSYFSKPGTRRPDGSTTPDIVFDSANMDINKERASINTLLSRTRDIRLLVLLAQWEALAGRLAPLAETVDVLARLLDQFGSDLHPQLAGGPVSRRDALSDLANQVTMIQPLLFAGLTGTDEVSLRKIKVASGTLTPMQNEVDLKSAALSNALGDSANKDRVQAVQAALLTLSQALKRIVTTCQTDEITPFAPALGPLIEVVDEMLAVIATAHPDLQIAETPSVQDADANDDTSPPGPAVIPVSVDMPTGVTVTSQTHAKGLLEACEHYYRQAEPSSAALLLITQARLLIGRPLIEALETLLPEHAAKTIIDFGPQTGFSLNIDRLRQLTDSAPESAAPEPLPQETDSPIPTVRTGVEAAGTLHTVEHYFMSVEKSSPVPILLKRARSYLHRDFQSLVDELIPDLETKLT